MPPISEKRKQYMREYRLKNKDKIKESQRQYRLENKEKYKQHCREYEQTPERKKSQTIRRWKQQGIIFHDFDLLYEIYTQTTHCDECNCLLNQCDRSRKCVDHDHSITDDENVRNILCLSCNVERG